MILTRLRMRNFRQYRGDHDLRFADTPERNVTVVTAPNGAGKTGLFIALNWCLYGDAGGDRGELLHKGEIERPEGYVEVHFRHDGRQYIARRDLFVKGDREVEGELQLDALEPGGKVRSMPDPSGRLNGILPSDARRYFFFDGERIDEMSRPGHEDEVNDAVRSVLKLRVLERAVEHLRQVERKLAKEARQHAAVSENASALMERTELINDRIEELRGQKQATQHRIRQAREELDEVRSRIQAQEEVREVARREQLLEQELVRLEQERDGILDDLARELPRAGVALAAGALRGANLILDEKRSRGEIPSTIRQHLIDDLIEAGRCICDRELDPPAVDALRRRRTDAVSDELEEAVQLATGRIKSLGESRLEELDELQRLLQRRSGLVDEEEDVRRGLSELRERLRSDFSGDITELEAHRTRLEDDLGELHYASGRFDSDIAAAVEERDEAKVALQKLETTDRDARRLTRKFSLARDAANAAEELLERFSAHARAEIERETDRIFKSLVWKRGHFDRVEISEEYALDVIDRFGRSALKELSAGERQVLSLALIVAIGEVADHEAPLVIDTPFGRISKDVQSHLTERLPGAAGQLVLLVTDHELDDAARRQLDQRVGADYALEFDESLSITTIVEV